MGTLAFIRSHRFWLWLLLLCSVGAGVWWLVFQAPPPPGLEPVDATSVKTDAVETAGDTAPPNQDKERPEPKEAQLSRAELSLTSSDGRTMLEVRARQAEKHEKQYHLQEGTITFRNGNDLHLKLTITDATYEVFPATAPDAAAGAAQPPTDAYVMVEGSMHGELLGTGQSFDAKRLRWDEQTNVIQAESITYFGPRLVVNGEAMRITLPTGVVEFTGPVTSTINANAAQ